MRDSIVKDPTNMSTSQLDFWLGETHRNVMYSDVVEGALLDFDDIDALIQAIEDGDIGVDFVI